MFTHNKAAEVTQPLWFLFQNDDIETDLNKLYPKRSLCRPFEELKVYERFFLELSEDFQVIISDVVLFSQNWTMQY